MDMEKRVRDSFARQSMMDTLGAKIANVAPGAVEITAPILPIALQQQGFGHAGLAFSLGDTAAGYSALSLMPEDQEVVTAEIRIHLLAPARGDQLIARGKVIKPGRRLVVVQAEVFARTGGREVQIALLTGTMVPVPA
ncbi:uncharacterized domain 1-containing protein [Citreimonas salinaria]|uniref:Uncharacterized domain 1-containing protein n=2 Tax=Citreimonas salinaria TaxID=321339 RepID=A0A1H3JAB0_9RHOB|nr:PaaI family thioesterase [Citreimonas salinaria]SDY36519.1 uncharacterized domain 1-containing protein [Citreimonas salinaria]